VKGIDPTAHPKVLARCKVLDSVTLIGTRKDLWKFTCKPVESEKDLSNPFKLKRVLPSAGRMNNVSSAFNDNILENQLLTSPSVVCFMLCFHAHGWLI
jgi:hypothetical protein